MESSTTDQPQNQRKAVLNLKDRCLCSLFYFFMETLKIKFHERSYFKIKAGLSAVSVVIHKHDCTVLIWQSYYCYFCSIPNFYFFVYPFWFCQMTAPVCAVSTAFLLMFRVFYKLTMSCHYHQVLTLLMKHWKAPVLFCLFFSLLCQNLNVKTVLVFILMGTLRRFYNCLVAFCLSTVFYYPQRDLTALKGHNNRDLNRLW